MQFYGTVRAVGLLLGVEGGASLSGDCRSDCVVIPMIILKFHTLTVVTE